MLNRAREKLLEMEIRWGEVPSCIAVVISAEDLDHRWWRKVAEMADWCVSLGIRETTLFSERVGPESVRRSRI